MKKAHLDICMPPVRPELRISESTLELKKPARWSLYLTFAALMCIPGIPLVVSLIRCFGA